MGRISPQRAERIKRSLVQSNSITATWTWFMTPAAKAAEPVLVASVLYASVKLLPIVHFPLSTTSLFSSPSSWLWISGLEPE